MFGPTIDCKTSRPDVVVECHNGFLSFYCEAIMEKKFLNNTGVFIEDRRLTKTGVETGIKV